MIEQINIVADNEEEIKRLKAVNLRLAIRNAALLEWIVLADTRLEIADDPQCIEVARSYLQAALEDN